MIVVGGVSELYQGDLDIGRLAVEALAPEFADRPDVAVEDFYYGPVAVAQRLAELGPTALVLVGAVERGRPPGSVHLRRWGSHRTGPVESQAAIGDAVVGYVGVDLLIEVGRALGALPPEVAVVEVEPASTASSTELSPEAARALGPVLAAVRAAISDRAASVRVQSG